MKGRTAQEVLGLRFDRTAFVSQLALALALAALWLLGRRYGGFTHDASIYVLQGLRVLEPVSFAKELFFQHGAQDAYTIFPRIYAFLIEAFGAGIAAVTVTIAGQVFFFAAAVTLVLRIVEGPARWWSLALLAVVSGYYGGAGVFRLAEPFATARTLAEPLVLLALACSLAYRKYAALAALAVAAVVHPLVAAPGIAALFFWHATMRPRTLWIIPVLGGLLPVIALLWPGVMQRFDPPWLAAVMERSPHLFVANWPIQDWARLLWGLCVMWLAARFVEVPVRRLVGVVATVGLVGVTASWIAVDLLDNAFAAGLQLWRTHWLAHFFAIVLVPVAVAGLWRSGNAARVAAACLAASCCFGRAELPAAAAMSVLAAALAYSGRCRPGWMRERLFRWSLLAIVFSASAGLLFEFQVRMPSAYDAIRLMQWKDYAGAAATVGGLMPLAVLLWIAAYSRFSVVALVAATATFALSVAAWDARGPWPRFVDEASVGANPFRNALPPDAVVFWPSPHGMAWVVLGRPNWFSPDQGAGIVFNRGTAIEFADRARASFDLRSAIDNCKVVAQPACQIDVRPVRELCERQGGPDYLVLNARVDGYRSIEWHLPAYIGPGRQSLFLFDCRAFAGNEKGRR